MLDALLQAVLSFHFYSIKAGFLVIGNFLPDWLSYLYILTNVLFSLFPPVTFKSMMTEEIGVHAVIHVGLVPDLEASGPCSQRF